MLTATKFLLLAFASGCLGGHVSKLASYKAEEKFIADTILGRDFDKDARPPNADNAEGPTNVSLSLYVMELGLCTKHQEVIVGGYFRQHWKDPRLAIDLGGTTTGGEENSNGNGDGTTTPAKKGKVVLKFRDMFEDRKVWVPDTFIPGDKNGFLSKTDPATGGRSFLRVKCCGHVLASMKFRTQSICVIPKDATEAKCKLQFESYGQQADEIMYDWKKGGVEVSDEAKEMVKASGNGWELDHWEVSEDTIDLATGSYNRGIFNLFFKKVAE